MKNLYPMVYSKRKKAQQIIEALKKAPKQQPNSSEAFAGLVMEFRTDHDSRPGTLFEYYDIDKEKDFVIHAQDGVVTVKRSSNGDFKVANANAREIDDVEVDNVSTIIDKILKEGQADKKKSWDDYDKSAPRTPWGNAQNAYIIDRGVIWYGTAGHGGLGVANGVASRKLSPQARELGEKWGQSIWYEEDVAWAIAFYEHPEWSKEMARIAGGKDSTKEEMKKIIESYWPQYFTQEFADKAKGKHENVKSIDIQVGDDVVFKGLRPSNFSISRIEGNWYFGYAEGRVYRVSKNKVKRYLEEIIRNKQTIWKREASKKASGPDSYIDALAKGYKTLIDFDKTLRTDKDFQNVWGKVLDWATTKDKEDEQEFSRQRNWQDTHGASKMAQFTTIDNQFKVKDIKNLNSLPKEVQEEVKSRIVDTIRSYGFQELLGYKGRQVVWSLGGHWDKPGKEDAKFIGDSFGSQTIQWDGDKVTSK